MSQKERSYWECPIKLSTKPSKPKNRTWIFPKTKDEENWWHGYTKKKTNTRGNQILIQNLCSLQFPLVFSCCGFCESMWRLCDLEVLNIFILCCVFCKSMWRLCDVQVFEHIVLASEVLWKIFPSENIVP